LYKSFFRKSTPSDTVISPSGIGWRLKDVGTALCMMILSQTDNLVLALSLEQNSRNVGERGCGRTPLNVNK